MRRSISTHNRQSTLADLLDHLADDLWFGALGPTQTGLKAPTKLLWYLIKTPLSIVLPSLEEIITQDIMSNFGPSPNIVSNPHLLYEHPDFFKTLICKADKVAIILDKLSKEKSLGYMPLQSSTEMILNQAYQGSLIAEHERIDVAFLFDTVFPFLSGLMRHIHALDPSDPIKQTLPGRLTDSLLSKHSSTVLDPAFAGLACSQTDIHRAVVPYAQKMLQRLQDLRSSDIPPEQDPIYKERILPILRHAIQNQPLPALFGFLDLTAWLNLHNAEGIEHDISKLSQFAHQQAISIIAQKKWSGYGQPNFVFSDQQVFPGDVDLLVRSIKYSAILSAALVGQPNSRVSRTEHSISIMDDGSSDNEYVSASETPSSGQTYQIDYAEDGIPRKQGNYLASALNGLATKTMNVAFSVSNFVLDRSFPRGSPLDVLESLIDNFANAFAVSLISQARFIHTFMQQKHADFLVQPEFYRLIISKTNSIKSILKSLSTLEKPAETILALLGEQYRHIAEHQHICKLLNATITFIEKIEESPHILDPDMLAAHATIILKDTSSPEGRGYYQSPQLFQLIQRHSHLISTALCIYTTHRNSDSVRQLILSTIPDQWKLGLDDNKLRQLCRIARSTFEQVSHDASLFNPHELSHIARLSGTEGRVGDACLAILSHKSLLIFALERLLNMDKNNSGRKQTTLSDYIVVNTPILGKMGISATALRKIYLPLLLEILHSIGPQHTPALYSGLPGFLDEKTQASVPNGNSTREGYFYRITPETLKNDVVPWAQTFFKNQTSSNQSRTELAQSLARIADDFFAQRFVLMVTGLLRCLQKSSPSNHSSRSYTNRANHTAHFIRKSILHALATQVETGNGAHQDIHANIGLSPEAFDKAWSQLGMHGFITNTLAGTTIQACQPVDYSSPVAPQNSTSWISRTLQSVVDRITEAIKPVVKTVSLIPATGLWVMIVTGHLYKSFKAWVTRTFYKKGQGVPHETSPGARTTIASISSSSARSFKGKVNNARHQNRKLQTLVSNMAPNATLRTSSSHIRKRDVKTPKAHHTPPFNTNLVTSTKAIHLLAK